MTKEELIERGYAVSGGNLRDLSTEKIMELMTVTQFVTDTCLNELESRDELTTHMGFPVVPYVCDHTVPTILTREQ
jgi:hypothetical protein